MGQLQQRTRTELVSYAVQTNHCEDIRSLILDGFQINSREQNFDPNTFPMTLCGFAACEHEIDVLLVLIELGANVNLPSSDGKTPLHLAIQFMNTPFSDNRKIRSFDMTKAVIQLLIYYGADVCASDCMLESPLHKAARLGYPAIVKLILYHGAEILTVSKNGLTAGDVCKNEMEKLTCNDKTIKLFDIPWLGNSFIKPLDRYRISNRILETAHIKELAFRKECISEFTCKRLENKSKQNSIDDIRDVFHKIRQQFTKHETLKTTPINIFDELIKKGYLNPHPLCQRVFPIPLVTPL